MLDPSFPGESSSSPAVARERVSFPSPTHLEDLFRDPEVPPNRRERPKTDWLLQIKTDLWIMIEYCCVVFLLKNYGQEELVFGEIHKFSWTYSHFNPAPFIWLRWNVYNHHIWVIIFLCWRLHYQNISSSVITKWSRMVNVMGTPGETSTYHHQLDGWPAFCEIKTGLELV